MPDATELNSYGMPTYKHNGRALAHFAAAKKHCALYGGGLDAFAEELRPYKTLKGTVQFPLDRPISMVLGADETVVHRADPDFGWTEDDPGDGGAPDRDDE